MAQLSHLSNNVRSKKYKMSKCTPLADDEAIKIYVDTHGTSRWSSINLKDRSTQSCTKRWFRLQQLDPELSSEKGEKARQGNRTAQ